MAKTLKEKMDSLSPERRKKIEAMTAELITDEKSLRDLRHALALTQEHMAEVLGVGQESISRLEKRSDLLLSTLRGYVKAMGGELRLSLGLDEPEPKRDGRSREHRAWAPGAQRFAVRPECCSWSLD